MAYFNRQRDPFVMMGSGAIPGGDPEEKKKPEAGWMEQVGRVLNDSQPGSWIGGALLDWDGTVKRAEERLGQIGAAYRQDNMIVSGLQYLGDVGSLKPGQIDPNYNVWKEIEGTPYEDHWDSFVSLERADEVAMMKRRIDRETQDRATLATAGLPGVLMSMGAGMADPTILLPGGALVRSAEGGFTLVKSAAVVGGMAAAGTVIQEGVLQATQETRPLSESAVNIGASFVLGALLGGAGAAAMSKAELAQAEEFVAPLYRMEGTGKGASGGAAYVEGASLDDLTVAGADAKIIAEWTQVSPNMRANFRAIPEARETAQLLARNSLYQRMHSEGRTLGASAETEAKVNYRSRMAQAIGAHNEAFSAMKKAGLNMSRQQFEEAVGVALRNGDEGPNAHITKAAKEWRAKVFDPFKDEAIEMGLLPADVTPTDAASYFSRVYNQQMLTAKEPQVKAALRAYYNAALRGQYQAAKVELEEALAKSKSAAAKAKLERAFFDRWEVKAMGDLDGDTARFDDYAKDIVDHIYRNLTGRGDGAGNPDFVITPLTKGPMKERTLHVPDNFLNRLGILDNNVVSVAERYSRQMAGEIELTRRFQSSDMKGEIKKITDAYEVLREQVAAAKTVADAYKLIGKNPLFIKRLEADGARSKEKLLAYLTKDEKGAIADIEALRDLVRGTYKVTEHNTNYGRWLRGLGQFNYITKMGGALIGNLTEIYRPAMVHGLRATMGQFVLPLITDLKAIKLSIKEAQLLGQVTEAVTPNRLMDMGEIGDPYRAGTAVERFMANTTSVASKWSGLVYWTDAIKAIGATLSQNRILEAATLGGKATARDRRLLAYLGINPEMAGRIAEQFAKHGDTQTNVRIANTERWDDLAAVRAYRSAVADDVDSIVVTKSVGDVPLFANTPTGKALLQFRQFIFASHQRVLLRGLQEDKRRFVQGMVGMTAVGILVAYARAWRGGEKRWERFQQAAQNPGYLIGEGLDATGIFSLPIEVGNIMERWTGAAGQVINPDGDPASLAFNPIKSPLKGAFADKSQAGTSLRYQSRGWLGSTLGPTFGMIEDIPAAGGALIARDKDGNVPTRNANAAKGFIPFGSYLGMREGIQMLTEDSPYLGGDSQPE
jgi:hypothetical protein